MFDIVFYRYEICGNIVTLLKNRGGTLSCCVQAMTKLEHNTTDGAKEKHVPFITKVVKLKLRLDQPFIQSARASY